MLGWREKGNFDTAAVIHVFVAIGVNGACRVTAHLALRGAACRDTQSTLPSLASSPSPLPPEARVLNRCSFHAGHVDQKLSGDRKKKKGHSIEFFFFFLPFFRKMERNLKNLRNIRCSWKNSFNQHAIVRDFF